MSFMKIDTYKLSKNERSCAERPGLVEPGTDAGIRGFINAEGVLERGGLGATENGLGCILWAGGGTVGLEVLEIFVGEFC